METVTILEHLTEIPDQAVIAIGAVDGLTMAILAMVIQGGGGGSSTGTNDDPYGLNWRDTLGAQQ